MRILLLTQLFQPEPNFLKGLAFATALQRHGHSIEVLTGFPNYPGGKVYPGYSRRLWMRETIEGVDVVRVWHHVSHDRSAVRRATSYLSFVVSAVVFGAPAIRRPDVIHVYQGPAPLMIAAKAISVIRGGRIVLDVQDLWPESVTDSGMLPPGIFTRALDVFCGWTYRRASRVVVLSEGFRQLLVQRGVAPEKIDVVLNWCDESSVVASEQPGGPPLAPEQFAVVYAGSMGPLQGLDAVIDAAALLNTTHPHIRFVFIGTGIHATELQERAASQRLGNVAFLPRQSPERVAHLLSRADALLIHLKENQLSKAAIPQKTQAYLAAGRPIVVGVNGEAADLVERAGAGVRCRAGDARDIARAVTGLAALPPAVRAEMGRRGRDFYASHLSFARGCDAMARVFDAAASGTTS